MIGSAGVPLFWPVSLSVSLFDKEAGGVKPTAMFLKKRVPYGAVGIALQEPGLDAICTICLIR